METKQPAPGWRQQFERVVTALLEACREHYGERLISFVVYGSVGRGTPRPDSDLDVLIVVDPLPNGRGARVQEYMPIERERLASVLKEAHEAGVDTFISPLIKTPAEAEYGTPIFLDMIEDGRILFDRDDFMKRRLERLQRRLTELGSRRIWRDATSYWDLKPDYKPGDIIEL